MKRVYLLLVGLLCLSVSVIAGEVITNDSGEDATGLRVSFSTPVLITAFGDILTTVDPQMLSFEFVFSGGIVKPWDSQWFNYAPATATVVQTEWLTSTSSSSSPSADAVAVDFDYEVTLTEIDTEITISRHIDRNCLPFSVIYSIVDPQTLDNYIIAWDTDKYVDSDSDGDPQNDLEFEGLVLELLYLENYNPTITLLVLDVQGDLIDQWENMARNDFSIDSPIELDTAVLLAHMGLEIGSAPDASWDQLHMARMDLEYITEYEATLDSQRGEMATATHAYPGKYVYVLASDDGTSSGSVGRIAAWVTHGGLPPKRVGLVMGDLWNEIYDPASDSMIDRFRFFTDAQAFEKLDWLREQGFEHIEVVDMLPHVQLYPEPLLGEACEEMHYIPDEDLERLLREITQPHVRTSAYATCFEPDDPQFRYHRYVEQHSQAYTEAFLDGFRGYLLQHARLAEEAGAKTLSLSTQPYLTGLAEIAEVDPARASYVRSYFIDLLAELRTVFSGSLGLQTPIPFSVDDPAEYTYAIPIAREADFLYEELASFHRDDSFSPAGATIAELGSAYSDYVDGALRPIWELYETPLQLSFFANSIEGASATGWLGSLESDTYETWKPEFSIAGSSDAILTGRTNPLYPPDFREQTRMVEALMSAFAPASFIEGVFARYEFWKLLDFGSFIPSGILDYFNVFTGSLQGKPAFEAYRFWASMLAPNQRLLYRRLSSTSLDAPSTDNDQGLAALMQVSWQDAKVVGELSRDYRPGEFWSQGGSHPIEQSSHWELPGHAVRSVRMIATEQLLAIGWEGWEADLGGAFRYQVRLYDPLSRSTLFIAACPLEGVLELAMSFDGVWRVLPSDLADFEYGPDFLAIYLPADLLLPSGARLSEAVRWSIECELVFFASEQRESYPLFEARSYSSL